MFGSWCLFGIRDKPPHIGTSNVILNTTLCNVVPMISGVQHDNAFTLRMHQFGVDLGFDRSGFRITSRYKMVNGSAEDLNFLLAIAPNCNGIVIQAVPNAELRRVAPNTFFRDDHGVLMTVTEVTNDLCQCKVLSTKEVLRLSVDEVRLRAQTYRLALGRR